IDGSTSLAFSEDVGKRYEAYHWYVQHIDGHDPAQIREALDKAVAEPERPSLIIARTHIGIGSPQVDSSKAHGEPLGEKDVIATKKAIGWPLEPTFLVPDEVRALFAERAKDGAKAHAEWRERVGELKKKGGPVAELYDKLMRRYVPANLL